MMLTQTTLQRFPALQTFCKTSARSMTVLSKGSSEEFKKQNYCARQEKKGRPVSPHVTIYSFPVTALSSITNRVTGVALSGVFGVLGLAEIASSGTALEIMQTIGNAGMIAYPAKFCMAFPIIYHYNAGLRHLVWDYSPDKLTNEEVEKASYALFGASTVISAAICIL